jgi:CMP-N-acetylneuraminic acid synthetase
MVLIKTSDDLSSKGMISKNMGHFIEKGVLSYKLESFIQPPHFDKIPTDIELPEVFVNVCKLPFKF